MEGAGAGQVCRACLRRGGELRDLLEAGGGEELLDMLRACTDTPVTETDELPKSICSACVTNLSIAYEFKKMCEYSYKWLLENYHKVNNEDEKKFKVKLEIQKTDESDITLSVNDFDLLNLDYVACKEEKAQTFVNLSDTFGFDDIGVTPNEIVGTNKGKRKQKRKRNKVKLKKSQLPKTLSCRFCPKMFTFPYLLSKHMEIHTRTKSYFCPICEKNYKSEIDHNKTHRNKSKFMCDICSKCFNTKTKVQIHIETHSENRTRNFMCDVPGCDKAYMTIQGITRHKIIHTGDKNFLCHLCSKAFTDKSGLLLHMLYHNKEKTYKCKICGKAFFSPSNRLQHEQRHTSEKRFSCEECNRSFMAAYYLKRHMLTHSNELLSHCSFCPKKFARSDNKKRHELVIHGFVGGKDKNVIVKNDY